MVAGVGASPQASIWLILAGFIHFQPNGRVWPVDAPLKFIHNYLSAGLSKVCVDIFFQPRSAKSCLVSAGVSW